MIELNGTLHYELSELRQNPTFVYWYTQSLIVHPFLTGRLARWRLVEQWLETTLKEKKVWFATLGEIADHCQSLRLAGAHEPRVENLPYFDGPVS